MNSIHGMPGTVTPTNYDTANGTALLDHSIQDIPESLELTDEAAGEKEATQVARNFARATAGFSADPEQDMSGLADVREFGVSPDQYAALRETILSPEYKTLDFEEPDGNLFQLQFLSKENGRLILDPKHAEFYRAHLASSPDLPLPDLIDGGILLTDHDIARLLHIWIQSNKYQTDAKERLEQLEQGNTTVRQRANPEQPESNAEKTAREETLKTARKQIGGDKDIYDYDNKKNITAIKAGTSIMLNLEKSDMVAGDKWMRITILDCNLEDNRLSVRVNGVESSLTIDGGNADDKEYPDMQLDDARKLIQSRSNGKMIAFAKKEANSMGEYVKKFGATLPGGTMVKTWDLMKTRDRSVVPPKDPKVPEGESPQIQYFGKKRTVLEEKGTRDEVNLFAVEDNNDGTVTVSDKAPNGSYSKRMTYGDLIIFLTDKNLQGIRNQDEIDAINAEADFKSKKNRHPGKKFHIQRFSISEITKGVTGLRKDVRARRKKRNEKFEKAFSERLIGSDLVEWLTHLPLLGEQFKAAR